MEIRRDGLWDHVEMTQEEFDALPNITCTGGVILPPSPWRFRFEDGDKWYYKEWVWMSLPIVVEGDGIRVREFDGAYNPPQVMVEFTPQMVVEALIDKYHEAIEAQVGTDIREIPEKELKSGFGGGRPFLCFEKKKHADAEKDIEEAKP